MEIRQECKSDYENIYNLIKEAFAAAEHCDGNEQDLVTALRESVSYVPELALVAVKDGEVVGHIMFTEAMIGEQTVLVLAPLSVKIAFQRQGIGTALVTEGHGIARKMGYKYCMVLGSERYYPKFGYIQAERLGVEVPQGIPSENFMGICLADDEKSVSGKLIYAKEFGI